MGEAIVSVHPVTPVIGADIAGVDLGDLDDGGVLAIHDALMAHGVLFFRDQEISIETQKAFGSRSASSWSTRTIRAWTVIRRSWRSMRTRIEARRGRVWHSAVSSDPVPPMGSILRLHTVPETGGDTLFASMYAACETLSDRWKTLLDGLIAIHDGGPYYRDVNRLLGRDGGGREYPRAEHPVIRTHPVTGRKAIFVNRMFTMKIVDRPEA